MTPKRALLLDMDGTLITTKSGETFPKDVDDWQFAFENVIGRIHQFKAKGYMLAIVTNQGGVEANFVTEDEVQEKLAKVVKALQRPDAKTDYIHTYYCPSMDSYYRKPNAGMAYKFALEHEVDLSESIMVGDMGSDKEFARRAGIGTFHFADEFFSNPVNNG